MNCLRRLNWPRLWVLLALTVIREHRVSFTRHAGRDGSFHSDVCCPNLKASSFKPHAGTTLAPTLSLPIHRRSPPTCPRADAQLANELGCSLSTFDPKVKRQPIGRNVTLASNLTGLLSSVRLNMICMCHCLRSTTTQYPGFSTQKRTGTVTTPGRSSMTRASSIERPL